AIEAVPALALERVDDVNSPAAVQMRRRSRFVERDRFRGRGAVAQLQPQVAAIATERLGPHHLDLTAEQQRLPIANAKRGEHLNFLVKARLEIGEGRRCLDRDRSGEGVALESGRGVLRQAFPQLRKTTGEHRKTRGHGMPAKSMEQGSAILQAVHEVETLDAPS